MTYIGKNFRTFLRSNTALNAKVQDRIYDEHVPQTKTKPYIWFRKRQGLSLDMLSPDIGTEAKDFSFDVEIVADSQPQTKVIFELFSTCCNFYRGALGDLTAQGIFVQDQDGDYEPQSIGGDTGVFVEAADVRVVVQ
jgi:predicted membrane-bound spermidine synthase